MLPDKQYLNECFYYNNTTGELKWKERPENHFNDKHTTVIINKRHAGKSAGTTKKQFAHVRLQGKFFCLTRVIWKLVTGEDPNGVITFADKSIDNLYRFENLKIKYENADSSRLKWVYPNKEKFDAFVTHNKSKLHLGTFDTKEEAHYAALSFKQNINKRD